MSTLTENTAELVKVLSDSIKNGVENLPNAAQTALSELSLFYSIRAANELLTVLIWFGVFSLSLWYLRRQLTVNLVTVNRKSGYKGDSDYKEWTEEHPSEIGIIKAVISGVLAFVSLLCIIGFLSEVLIYVAAATSPLGEILHHAIH